MAPFPTERRTTEMKRRIDGRLPDELRPVQVTTGFVKHAEGSVLMECGDTRVVCTASVEKRVPPFLRGAGQGWVTAEYGMLPRSTNTRMIREVSKGKLSGRSQEIQRLIGRSLRAVVDLQLLGERTVWLDCDVLQADGGTRTTSITGAFLALALALDRLRVNRALKEPVLLSPMAAVSVGIVGDEPLLDLNYREDFAAEVDMNVVMTGREEYVEIQGTAEGAPFGQSQLDRLLELARGGIRELIAKQRAVLEQSTDDAARLFRPDAESSLAIPVGDSK